MPNATGAADMLDMAGPLTAVLPEAGHPPGPHVPKPAEYDTPVLLEKPEDEDSPDDKE